MAAHKVPTKTQSVATGEMFDSVKFQELVLYIAAACGDHSSFGAVKLNKLLFFSDFIYFSDHGVSITGARYQKLPNGPAPRCMLPMKKLLIDSGAAIERSLPVAGVYVQNQLVALRAANLEIFKAAEISVVDHVISKLARATAKKVSDISHQFKGWELASMYEDIPYGTVLIPSEPIPLTEDQIDRATKLARKIASGSSI